MTLAVLKAGMATGKECVCELDIISQHLLGGTEENHKLKRNSVA
jgi:hypothetical protein